MQSKPSSLKRGHPAWSKKSRYLANDFFVARSIVTNSVDQQSSVFYGIVVKKKIGHAVLRNRIKRRLRSAFGVLESHRTHHSDSVNQAIAHVVVVRSAAVAHMPFLSLCDYLQSVLKPHA